MAIYSLAQATTATHAGAFGINPAWEIQTGSTDDVSVLEISFGWTAATTAVPQDILLGRPPTRGVGTAVTFVAEDFDSPVSTTTGIVTWTTGQTPGVPTSFLRRVNLNGADRDPIVWYFPEGLRIAASGSLALYISGADAGATADVWCVVNE